MLLNKRQKEYLFENGYVTAKVLDACVEKGWKDYYIKFFRWTTKIEEKTYKTVVELKLKNKEFKDIEIIVILYMDHNDYKVLNELGGKSNE